MRIVASDIGGTHARFAIAEIKGGAVHSIGPALTLKTTDYISLQSAWEAFVKNTSGGTPQYAAIALACPIAGKEMKMTNSEWIVRPAQIKSELGLEAFILVNDFAAVAHAVANLDATHFYHLHGPARPLAKHGVVSIIGPGTGLGVGLLLRQGTESYNVVESEGGHIGFAPLDDVEDVILARLRARYGRVSAERVVSGSGLMAIYETLADIEGESIKICDIEKLWACALEGQNPLAAAALGRFCAILGAVAGDIALAQGAACLVIAGSLGARLAASVLPHSDFGARFTAKGRFEKMMKNIPVKLITYPEPGLFGAAAAFSQEASRKEYGG